MANDRCVWCGKSGTQYTGGYCSRACIAADPDAEKRIAQGKDAEQWGCLIALGVVGAVVYFFVQAS